MTVVLIVLKLMLYENWLNFKLTSFINVLYTYIQHTEVSQSLSQFVSDKN